MEVTTHPNKPRPSVFVPVEETPELLHAIVTLKTYFSSTGSQPVDQQTNQHLSIIANGKILAVFDSPHSTNPPIKKFQFMNSFDKLEQPKDARTLALTIQNEKVELEFNTEQETQTWHESLAKSIKNKLKGNLKLLKQKVVTLTGLKVWFTPSNLENQTMLQIQRQSERHLFETNFISDQSNKAYTEILKLHPDIEKLKNDSFHCAMLSTTPQTPKVPAIFITNGVVSLDSQLGHILKPSSSQNKMSMQRMFSFNKSIETISIQELVQSDYSFDIIQENDVHTRLYFDTVGELLYCLQFFETVQNKKLEESQIKNAKDGLKKENIKLGFQHNHVDLSYGDSKSKSDNEPKPFTYENQSNLKRTNIMESKDKKNLTREELVKKANLAEKELEKMSRNKELPTGFFKHRDEKVQNFNFQQEFKLIGQDILSQRRGDSFGIFSIIEQAKRKWYWWQEIDPASATKKIQTGEIDEVMDVDQSLVRWMEGLEWYKKIITWMEEQNMRESIELFEQAFSLELAEFCTSYWNNNVQYLTLEQLIKYHSYVAKCIKWIQIFSSGEETRLESLKESLIYSIESVFLNEFVSYILSVLEDFWIQENYVYDGKYIFNNSFTNLVNRLDGFLKQLTKLDQEASKEIIQRIFMIVGYIITENFVGIFKNKFSINELFLIYAFIEKFVNYFNEKTLTHDKNLIYFDHLTSLMKVTSINIENYLHYFVIKLKDIYFEFNQINQLLDILKRKFCLAKYISPSLCKKIWSILMIKITLKYTELYFVRESLEIKTVDLATKLTWIEQNAQELRGFFEEFISSNLLNECIQNITYLVKFAKTSTPKDIVESIKIMINRDVVSSDSHISNSLEMKTRSIQDKQKLFEQLKIINDLRIKELSTVTPSVITKISNKLFIKYIYLYSWVFKKKDFKNRIFQVKKQNMLEGYKKYWVTLNMGKMEFYQDIGKTVLEETYNTLLLVSPAAYDNSEISFIYEGEEYLMQFPNYHARNLWLSIIQSLMDYTYENMNTLNVICKEKTNEIIKMQQKEGLISLNFDEKKMCERARITPATHDIMKEFTGKILAK